MVVSRVDTRIHYDDVDDVDDNKDGYRSMSFGVVFTGTSIPLARFVIIPPLSSFSAIAALTRGEPPPFFRSVLTLSHPRARRRAVCLIRRGGRRVESRRGAGEVAENTREWDGVYLVARHDYATAIDLLDPIVETSCCLAVRLYVREIVKPSETR